MEEKMEMCKTYPGWMSVCVYVCVSGWVWERGNECVCVWGDESVDIVVVMNVSWRAVCVYVNSVRHY